MYIAGVDDALATARELGDKSYCTGNNDAGLSAAIGGGCTVRQVEHTNAYASLARGGSYLPISYVLEVRNSANEVLKKWEAPKPKQAVDPQVAYMLSSILSDPNARSLTFGLQANSFGFNVPGVWTASKTATTENGQGSAKDSWFMDYSPVVATGVWMGNHDGSPLASSANDVVRRVANDYMLDVHNQVYLPSGAWKSGDQVPRPEGMKDLAINGRMDVYPSWFNQTAGRAKDKIDFDKVSKKRATDCTPADARVNLEVYKTTDPISKREIMIAPDGYNASSEDDLHKCEDVKPSVAGIEIKKASGDQYTITVTANQGTHQLSNLKIQVGGGLIADVPISGSGNYQTTTTIKKSEDITVTILDSAAYSTTASKKFTPSGGKKDND